MFPNGLNSHAQTNPDTKRATDSTFAEGDNGAIATGRPQAAEAGLQMLKSGGNAIDAAVTTLLVQTVVESHLYCFGGEVPIIVYDAKRDVVEVIAGLGRAPQLATPEWFNKNRNGVIQGRGDIANAVVPGILGACVTAFDRFGTKTFSNCAEAMLTILDARAKMDPEKIQAGRRRNFDPQKWVAHHDNFHDMIKQLCEAERKAGPDRQRGLRAVADYFYRGPIAREVDRWSKSNGGLLRYTDMARHQTRVEELFAMDFKG